MMSRVSPIAKGEIDEPGNGWSQVGRPSRAGGAPALGHSGRGNKAVSGGIGTIPVTYMGKTYYVCCTGCRDAFRDEPEKYIKEFEARKKKKD